MTTKTLSEAAKEYAKERQEKEDSCVWEADVKGFTAGAIHMAEIKDAEIKRLEHALLVESHASEALESMNKTLQGEISRLRLALEFYADHEKMYDCAYDVDCKTVGYVRGIDPYDSTESDFEKIEGERTLHHGKRAREALTPTQKVD